MSLRLNLAVMKQLQVLYIATLNMLYLTWTEAIATIVLGATNASPNNMRGSKNNQFVTISMNNNTIHGR